MRHLGKIRILPSKIISCESLIFTGPLLLSLLYLLAIPIVFIFQRNSLSGYYFFHQDTWLLVCFLGSSLCVAFFSVKEKTQPSLNKYLVHIIVISCICFSYIGTWLIMQRYAQSGDEYFADFAAIYLQHGHIGQPIPQSLRSLALETTPVWAARFANRGYWVSNYLPGSAAIRGAFGWLGDRWLASPAMLALGLASLWVAARKFWPERREAAVVVLVLASSSAQPLLTGMSPNAMATHFGINSLWLACFACGTKPGHAAAMLVTIVAVGLHQLQFHCFFIFGFIIWLLLIKRYILGLSYLIVVLSALALWKLGYTAMLFHVIGRPNTEIPATRSFVEATSFWIERLKTYQPHTSWIRLFVWNNILLIPLCLAGVTLRRKDSVATALCITCAVGLLTTIGGGGFEFGYRYIHPILPCFFLLAGYGWIRWNDERTDVLGSTVLWSSAVAGWLLTIPLASWMSYELQWPYSAGYRAIKSAHANFVVVDSRGVTYLNDLVRLDDPITRPIVMNLSLIDKKKLAELCRNGPLMIFDKSQASILNFPSVIGGAPDEILASRRKVLIDLNCGTPVPIDRKYRNY